MFDGFAAGVGTAGMGALAVANPYVAVGTAALQAFAGRKKKAPDLPPGRSGFENSPIDIDSSGWVVNFRGIASSSGARRTTDAATDALTSEVQTPVGNVPAWAIVAGVALVALVALKKRKAA